MMMRSGPHIGLVDIELDMDLVLNNSICTDMELDMVLDYSIYMDMELDMDLVLNNSICTDMELDMDLVLDNSI